VMRAWADDEHPPLQYPVGSLGPKSANQIFDQADQEWRQTLGCNGKADGKS
jgi:glucose-6-phosphate 1-dehydrogenase